MATNHDATPHTSTGRFVKNLSNTVNLLSSLTTGTGWIEPCSDSTRFHQPTKDKHMTFRQQAISQLKAFRTDSNSAIATIAKNTKLNGTNESLHQALLAIQLELTIQEGVVLNRIEDNKAAMNDGDDCVTTTEPATDNLSLNQVLSSAGYTTAKAPGNYKKYIIDATGSTVFTGDASEVWDWLNSKETPITDSLITTAAQVTAHSVHAVQQYVPIIKAYVLLVLISTVYLSILAIERVHPVLQYLWTHKEGLALNTVYFVDRTLNTAFCTDYAV